jgi:hypothetical protein
MVDRCVRVREDDALGFDIDAFDGRGALKRFLERRFC